MVTCGGRRETATERERESLVLNHRDTHTYTSAHTRNILDIEVFLCILFSSSDVTNTSVPTTSHLKQRLQQCNIRTHWQMAKKTIRSVPMCGNLQQGSRVGQKTSKEHLSCKLQLLLIGQDFKDCMALDWLRPYALKESASSERWKG